MLRIKQHRTQAGLTQMQLSKMSGVSREHLSNIENNKFEANLKTLAKIAKALNCDIKDLL